MTPTPEPPNPSVIVKLLEAVTAALSRLLDPDDPEAALQDALGLIGRADGVDRVYLFENVRTANRELAMCQRYEWVREGVSLQIDNPQLQSLPYSLVPSWLECLQHGTPYQRTVEEFDDDERVLLEPQDILSILAVPIMVRGEFWGLLGMDSCVRVRVWSDQEVLALQAAATGVGGAIIRRQTEQSLEAKAGELKRHRAVALSLMEDAQRSEKAAAKASQAKSTFLAMMSHEIRTPLNGVIGFTELLLAEGLPPRQSELAQAIRTCGETLLSLISDILDISKVESGNLDLEFTNGALADFMRSVLATFEQAAGKQGTRLSLVIDEGCPHWVRMDFNRFRQVLFNLIGNAVKFTRDGEVSTHLWMESGDEGVLQLHCEVRDTGAGIQTSDIQTIFEPFQQGERARHLSAGGSGLGLAICRRLVEAMGGIITVESELGKGSQFSFYVIVETAQEVAASGENPGQAAPVEGMRAKILVVDDVRMNVRLAQGLLERIGYSADAARDGREALLMTQQTSYDLIFMDILMPEMDGFETVQRIRMRPLAEGGTRPWIVALTADALVENRERCAEVGMDDFITKPLRINEMQACLDRWRAGVSTLGRLA